MITVKTYRYSQSTEGTLIQGVKGNRTPRGAVGGGYGSFIMPGNPPQIILIISNGESSYPMDIYNLVKANVSRRITQKFADTLCSSLVNASFNNEDALVRTILARL